jgi:hypothetical protein
MKKIFFLMIALGLLMSACGTSAKPSVPAGAGSAAAPAGAAVNPSPVAAVDLEATAAFMVQQTLQAMPTPTLMPSATPVIFTETPAATSTLAATPTLPTTAIATQNPILLTLTATLGTGTPAATEALPTATLDLSTPTETAYPRTYGTMPPKVPSGQIYLTNKAKSDATISLQCTRLDGGTTIIEYPVAGTIKVHAPAGGYHYVVWVGGKKYVGNFRLRAGEEAAVIIYKDHVETK